MVRAMWVVLFVGLVSTALFCAGLYLDHLEKLFPQNPNGWFWCNLDRDGADLIPLGLLGFLLTLALLAALGLTRLVQAGLRKI